MNSPRVPRSPPSLTGAFVMLGVAVLAVYASGWLVVSAIQWWVELWR